jgi:hypothetical protein
MDFSVTSSNRVGIVQGDIHHLNVFIEKVSSFVEVEIVSYGKSEQDVLSEGNAVSQDEAEFEAREIDKSTPDVMVSQLVFGEEVVGDVLSQNVDSCRNLVGDVEGADLVDDVAPIISSFSYQDLLLDMVTGTENGSTIRPNLCSTASDSQHSRDPVNESSKLRQDARSNQLAVCGQPGRLGTNMVDPLHFLPIAANWQNAQLFHGCK